MESILVPVGTGGCSRGTRYCAFFLMGSARFLVEPSGISPCDPIATGRPELFSAPCRAWFSRHSSVGSNVGGDWGGQLCIKKSTEDSRSLCGLTGAGFFNIFRTEHRRVLQLLFLLRWSVVSWCVWCAV